MRVCLNRTHVFLEKLLAKLPHRPDRPVKPSLLRFDSSSTQGIVIVIVPRGVHAADPVVVRGLPSFVCSGYVLQLEAKVKVKAKAKAKAKASHGFGDNACQHFGNTIFQE